jgi:hypothetical protein
MNYHEQLAPLVLDHVTHFRNDFLVYDRQALDGFAGAFILGIRSTGTNLLKFGGPHQADARFDQIVRVFLFHANERFFLGQDGRVTEVSRNRAVRRYEKAKHAGVRFFA